MEIWLPVRLLKGYTKVNLVYTITLEFKLENEEEGGRGEGEETGGGEEGEERGGGWEE